MREGFDLAGLKAGIDIATVAEDLGMDVRNDGKAWCIFHEEQTPSLQLYPQQGRWWAYCCGQGGDVIDLVKGWFGCSFGQAVRWLEGTERVERATGPSRTEEDPTERAAHLWDELATNWTHGAPEGFADLLHDRWGWRKDAAWPGNVGVAADRSGERAVHFLHTGLTGQLCGVKYCLLGSGTKRSFPKSTFPALWHPSLTPREYMATIPDVVLLVEGEPDAVTAWQNLDAGKDVLVLSLPSGAASWRQWHADVLLGLCRRQDVLVCMDNDTAGDQAMKKIERDLHWRVRRLKVPGLYNDLSDAVKAGWDLPAAVRKAMSHPPREGVSHG